MTTKNNTRRLETFPLASARCLVCPKRFGACRCIHVQALIRKKRFCHCVPPLVKLYVRVPWAGLYLVYVHIYVGRYIFTCVAMWRNNFMKKTAPTMFSFENVSSELVTQLSYAGPLLPIHAMLYILVCTCLVLQNITYFHL